MLLNFIKVDFRTKVLVEKYLELISEGVKPSEILVLVQNSTLKKQFVNKILENLKINAIEKLNVHSFFSIVYNTLVDNWCFIENSIPGDKRFILPNLVGLEVSQFLLKDILKQVPVKGYNSKKSLLHQIFRRYALIVQNHLTNEDVKERSKILKESFADDAEIVIKRLLGVTLKSRSLDYLRQTLIFNYVYKNTDYFKNIKYLLVDDADEMTPVCFDFITYLRPQLKDWVICFDSLGSSRCGYLSADTSIEYKLKKLFNEEVISQESWNYPPLVGADLRTDWSKYESPDSERMEPAKPYRLKGDTPGAWSKSKTGSKSLISGRGLNEYGVSAPNKQENCWEYGISSQIKNLTPPPSPLPQGAGGCAGFEADTQREGGCAQEFSSFRQGEIIFSNILENKKERLENFTLTSLSKRAEILDYTVEKIQNLFKKDVLPKDIAIITPLQDDMLHFALKENLKCNLLFLSGSEKLVDNPLVKSSLNILKLMLNLEITEMDLRVILADFAGIPLKYCNKILEYYKLNKKLPAESEFYNEKYKKFHDAFENVRNKNEKLSKKVFDMFYSGIDFVEEDKINKFNFFIKQLKDFENVLGGEKVIERAEDIIVQIENSIIAENPSTTLEIGDNDLVVATPQKIIDNKISTRYQFWLDVSHSDWVKTDTGPLYNAWVMQADWTKDEYTVEDDIFLSKQKTARILRKLLLLAGEHIWACSSLFDPSGVENLGGIEEYLAGGGDEPVEEKKAFRIIPRDDQKPVLDYRKGSMAISAVPGAGKTTILLALIIKLMDRGVNPENIYVLTYMDSAARNFRERIKNMCPNTNRLPNISTIHGLALKIIKENSNFERLNLSSDFEICDDTQRIRIIKAVGGKSTKTEVEEFDRAISVLKLQEGNIDTKSSDKKTEKFKTFYKEYQAELREANLIDYDDILIMSVKLLENNPDILKYYQNQCEYIIEDEAQDSSGVQQRLIALLSGKHKNLIRCGDINQAITTTFSNADVEGFRAFIHNADKTVEMNHSQRCTQEVMDLANKLVDFGDKILPKAFFKSYMHGVSGKNPESKNAIYSHVFENVFAERNFVLKEIKNILTKNKDSTIGILLRNNYQVNSWAEFINNAGLKTITRNDSLSQKGVFNTIFSILKFIQNPYDNEILVSTYETLSDLGFYKQRLQLEIRASEIPFIQKDGDDIESQDLSQFLWDMQYWLNSSTLPLEELVIKIGLFYYTSDIEKSNVYLIATLVKRLNSQGKFDLTLQRLEELSKKPTLSGFKFFSDEEDKDAMRGKVQIMTLHKSKGDEFEYVFLPEMAEKNLAIDIEKQNLKSSTLFMEEVKSFNPNYKRKSELELRQFNSEESLRLLYVAITRAQKKLYITTSAKAKGWGNKETTQEPSIIFGSILSKN